MLSGRGGADSEAGQKTLHLKQATPRQASPGVSPGYNHSTVTMCSILLNSGSPVKMIRFLFFAVATAKQSAKDSGYSAFILDACMTSSNPLGVKSKGGRNGVREVFRFLAPPFPEENMADLSDIHLDHENWILAVLCFGHDVSNFLNTNLAAQRGEHGEATQKLFSLHVPARFSFPPATPVSAMGHA